MDSNEIEKKVKNLIKLKNMAAELSEIIDSIQEDIKSEMSLKNTETLNGSDWKVTWKEYRSSRIDSKALRAEMPELAARFTKIITYKTFRLIQNK